MVLRRRRYRRRRALISRRKRRYYRKKRVFRKLSRPGQIKAVKLSTTFTASNQTGPWTLDFFDGDLIRVRMFRQWSAIYDKYKLKGIRIQWYPGAVPAVITPTAQPLWGPCGYIHDTNTAMKGGDNATIYPFDTAIGNVQNFNDLFTFENARIRSSNKMHSVYFKIQTQLPQFYSGAGEDGFHPDNYPLPDSKGWIPTRMYVNPPEGTDQRTPNTQSIRALFPQDAYGVFKVTYYVMFKEVRGIVTQAETAN